MTLPRNPGRNVALSPGRRIMCDMLRASQGLPAVSLERQINLRAVQEARRSCVEPPSWFALFIKAYALVAWRRPVMRRSFIRFPWARLYEHDFNVVSLPVERRIGDEDVVLFGRIWCPEEKSLRELNHEIRRLKTIPVEEEERFRFQLRVARLPALLRRLLWWLGLHVSGHWRMVQVGTFGITGVASLGANSLHFLSPLTYALSVSAIQPDGTAVVRLIWDHRVVDGVQPALALAEFEQCLNGELLAELRTLATAEPVGK